MSLFRVYAIAVMFALPVTMGSYVTIRVVVDADRRWRPVLVAVLVLIPAYTWWMANILIGWKKS